MNSLLPFQAGAVVKWREFDAQVDEVRGERIALSYWRDGEKFTAITSARTLQALQCGIEPADAAPPFPHAGDA